MTSFLPPIVNKSQPAFDIEEAREKGYWVHFEVPNSMSAIDIGHIQIRIVKQSNNKSIVNSFNGILYKNTDVIDFYSTDKRNARVRIDSKDLEAEDKSNSETESQPWLDGSVYKIQMRFGREPAEWSLGEYAEWEAAQIAVRNFSDWSTVMLVKAIKKPEIFIKNNKDKASAQIGNVEISSIPTFYGECNFATSSKEMVKKYRFALYEAVSGSTKLLLEDSGWLDYTFNASNLNTMSHNFSTVLTETNHYKVVMSIVSNNGYEGQTDEYEFQYLPAKSNSFDVDGYTSILYIEDDTEFCRENGCFVCRFGTSAEKILGNYVLLRASEKSEFQIWEDLQYFFFKNESFPISEQDSDLKRFYIDFTIENGVKYKYALQRITRVGHRSEFLNEKSTEPHFLYFESQYLFAGGIQLDLRFDMAMASFKNTTLTAKVDTIGSRYPTITRNGMAYYSEFPIGGTISWHQDAYNTFLSYSSGKYYLEDEEIINSNRLPQVEKESIFSTSLIAENVYAEKAFRDKVEIFLNDGLPKLYRSATEGNIIVCLTDITLQPVTALGRMLFGFTAMAYQIDDFSLARLDKNNIIDIYSSFNASNQIDPVKHFGQIDIYKEKETEDEIDILQLMKDEINAVKTNNPDYGFKFKQLLSFWIEEKDGSLLGERACIQLTTVGKGGENKTQNIFVTPGKVYSVDINFDNLIGLKTFTPNINITPSFLFNYTCLAELYDKYSNTLENAGSVTTWNQIAGIFWKQYNNSNIPQENDWEKNYDIESRDVLSHISELAIREAAKIGKVNLAAGNASNGYKTWTVIDKDTNRKTVFEFRGFNLLDIEAENGTEILFKTLDSENYQKIVVGPTGKYIFDDARDITNLTFSETSYAIINFVSPIYHEIHYIYEEG